MESRLAKLEATAEYTKETISDLKADVRAVRADIAGIRTIDFRILFSAIIGLAGIMAKGFHWF